MSDMMAGLPSDEEFDAAIAAKLRQSGVEPPAAVANPDRTRTAHNIGERAQKPGLLQNLRSPLPAYVPSPQVKYLDPLTFPWIGVLGAAQSAGHEVSVHLRQDPAIGFRGKVISDTPLSKLDEMAAASLKAIRLERDTGSAPRREITTILLADVVAITTIEKIEKK